MAIANPVEAVGAGTAILPPNPSNGPLIPTTSRASDYHHDPNTHDISSKTNKDVEPADEPIPILDAPPVPRPLSRFQLVVVAALVTFTLCMSSAGAMGLTIALPTIQDDLEMNEHDLQWIAAAYSLTNGCFLLLSGRLADVHGRKKMFLAGTIWNALWTLVGGFMNTGAGLVVTRALAGMGAAMR
jgi:hypothetical protein